MVTFDDYYEEKFGSMPLGTMLRVKTKEGGPYIGELLFKSKHFITLQLPYYREGFSVANFYTGHSTFRIWDGTEPEEDDDLVLADDEEEIPEDELDTIDADPIV